MKTPFTLALLFLASVLFAQDIKLPQPQKEGGMPLMEAFNVRQSTRSYSAKELTEQQLSNLMWAAFGFNREGQKKRTAPSSMNHQEMEVWVALKSGLYLYDAKAHVLLQKLKEDIREATGEQAFVKDAPVNIMFVANYADRPKLNDEKDFIPSNKNAGYMSQNVYLYCASEGLATVARGWYKEDKLKEAMQLKDGYRIILTQTVGYPKE